MRKTVIANVVRTVPTPGTKAGFVDKLHGNGGTLKKSIKLGGIQFPKGSIVKNLPGGVFIKDPKENEASIYVDSKVLGDFHSKYGYLVRSDKKYLLLITDAL